MCRLVCGDVRGKFAQLFTRVNNIQKKAGEFDVILVLLPFITGFPRILKVSKLVSKNMQ